MFLQFILGGIHADKTEKCFDLMQDIHKKSPQSPIIMLVPDQYSYTAEKRLAKRFGGAGLNHIEVLTFSRLCFRIRQEIPCKDYLTPCGKQMLIYKAIRSIDDNNNIFASAADKSGFVDVIGELICELKRYEITPDILLAQSEKVDNQMLKNKLIIISDIYRTYESLIDGNFSDSNNDLDLAADYIEHSTMFEDTYIYFDEFSDFLPQNYKVISAILKKASCTGISLCIPENAPVNDDTFDTCRDTYRKLKRLVNEFHGTTEDIPVPEPTIPIRSKELSLLLETWNDHTYRYNNPVSHISLFQGKNPYSEVDYTAAQILRLIRENHYRFHDIGILCGDPDAYNHIIEAVFSDYGIPYFTDSTVVITEHPIVMMVLSIFDIISNDWQYDAVFRYLRSGFIYTQTEDNKLMSISQQDVDYLENYILKYDIRSSKTWLQTEDWDKTPGDLFDDLIRHTPERTEGANHIDTLRRFIAAPFIRLKAACRGKCTVRTIAKKLFDFLTEIHLPDGLEYEIFLLQKENKMDEAEQFSQIWTLLVEALDQIVVTLGSETMSLDEFAAYFKIGLSKSEIRIIPSSIDHVTIGTVERSRSASVKALFIIGGNYGKIPADLKHEGILSNSDKQKLQTALDEIQMEISPDTKKREITQRYKLYKAISSAQDRLLLSYAAADSEDEALRPAQFILDILNKFPNIPQKDDILSQELEDISLISAPKPTFRHLMRNIHAPAGSVWEDVKKWYMQTPYWASKLNHILSIQQCHPAITSENARLLYGDEEKSVTQFENYSCCPFEYYLLYGLKAKPQEIWQIRSLDIGNLCHWIVQNYCEKVSQGAVSLDDIRSKWAQLDDNQSTEIVESLIQEAEEKTIRKLVHNANKMRNILKRVKRTVYRSIEIVNKSLKNSDYAEISCEQEFHIALTGSTPDEQIKLRGIIDRVDLLEENGKAYIRIIDYKSGKKEFDIADIYNQLSLQLVTYAITAAELYKKCEFSPKQGDFKDVQIGAILYNKIRDDISKSKENNREKAIEEGKKALKLNGMIFADTVDELLKMDKTIQATKKSEFLRASVTAKGEISKTGDVHKKDSCDLLCDYVRNVVIDIHKSIYSGNIDIHPYKKANSTPCEYCDYKEVCLFDASVHSYRTLITGKEKAWDCIFAYLNTKRKEEL